MNLTDPGDFKFRITKISQWVDIMQKNPYQYVNIRERISMQYSISKFKVQQYLPPSFKDSNFFVDLQAMIFKTGFKFENTFNF